MSMMRKLMRNVAKAVSKRSTMRNAPAVGSQRAGMHQKSEHEFQHSRMADNEHHPETAEDALDMPAAVEAEIPPVEEEDDEITADIAEGEAEIAPEAEILEETADPEASVEEEEAKTEELAQFAVDYSAERIPVLDPVTGGNGTDGSAELVYSSGDGSLKEIQEPLPGMERLGVMPYMPGVENPSANVADYEAPEPEPEPEPEPDPEPEIPAE